MIDTGEKVVADVATGVASAGLDIADDVTVTRKGASESPDRHRLLHEEVNVADGGAETSTIFGRSEQLVFAEDFLSDLGGNTAFANSCGASQAEDFSSSRMARSEHNLTSVVMKTPSETQHLLFDRQDRQDSQTPCCRQESYVEDQSLASATEIDQTMLNVWERTAQNYCIK